MTPLQAEALALFRETGNRTEVARRMGKSRATVRVLIDKAERWEEASPGHRDAVMSAELDIADASHGWIKADADGNVISRSTFWKAARKDDDPARIIEAIREGLADVPAPVSVPAPISVPDVCAVFPVADLHIGLLTHAEEVGEDWDGPKASRVFAETFERLAEVTPSAGTAVIAQLGDLLHMDDQTNQTRGHGHQLDAAERYYRALRRAVAAMKTAIEILRRKYPKVIYRGCRGNHDIHAFHGVTMALEEHYANTPGVEIMVTANEFWAYEFGKNMLIVHHGDRVKPERMGHFVPAEWPEMWGRTKHRLALSGHIHHATAREIGGLMLESIGTIIPRDPYAHSNGYTARRGLVSITLHRTQGEISRARIGL
jgi:predicted phosphodiesterase